MSLAELTTLQVGGDAAEIFAPATTDDLIEAARQTWASGDEWLTLGGGSNVVIADDGFDGTVLRVLTRGITRLERSSPATASLGDRPVRLSIEAGEPWDDVVQFAVGNGWAGIEALSGIPGSTGAAPVQNIGAYGQELSSSLVSIDFLDYATGELERGVPAAELALGYRTSSLKRGRQGIVLRVELALWQHEGGRSQPIAYAQLADALGLRIDDRAPVQDVRDAVLALRASKGMLLNPDDPNSRSAGSFFTNPIVSENFSRTLPTDAPRWPTAPEEAAVAVPLGETPAAPPATGEYQVKLSAAWLIEHAGISRGFKLPGSRAAVSSVHTLALVNLGGATAEDITELARYIQTRVMTEFGVLLQPEPVLVGVEL